MCGCCALRRERSTLRNKREIQSLLLHFTAGRGREHPDRLLRVGQALSQRHLTVFHLILDQRSSEQAHVRGMFLVHAIAWPAVAFSLVCDGDPVHRLRPAASLRERLDDLFGAGYLGAVERIVRRYAG